MTATAPVLGFDGKMYYNSGTYESPTWVLVDNVGDIEVTNAAEKVAIPIRRMGGFNCQVPGGIDYGLAFKMVHDPADTTLTALRTAYYTRTPVEILPLDGPIDTTGSQGVRATMGVFKCARGEPVNGVMMVDIELAPTYSGNAPARFTAEGED